MLRNAKVGQRISELQRAGAERALLKIEDVVRELMRVGFSNIANVVSWGPEIVTVEAEGPDGEPIRALQSRVIVRKSEDIPVDVQAAVAQIGQGANGSLSVKMHDKLVALEKLGRHLGMFKDEHGPLTIPDRATLIFANDDRRPADRSKARSKEASKK